MRVLLTRSENDAARTAERLARRGHEAVLAPLTAIVATGEPPPPERVDGVILTSAHAAPFLDGVAHGGAPVFAVGRRTAEAAARAGRAGIRTAEGDARALAALIRRELPPASALLHIAARHRKAEPGATLAAAGFAVHVWEAYEARAAAALPAQLPSLLEAGRIDAALHYSRRSAALLVALCERAGLAPALRALAHVCLSEDVAAALDPLEVHPVVAARPDEEALLAALDERLLRRGSSQGSSHGPSQGSSQG
jgi:uroporphyrinogen-III synthase